MLLNLEYHKIEKEFYCLVSKRIFYPRIVKMDVRLLIFHGQLISYIESMI